MADQIKPYPAGGLVTFEVQFARPWQIVRPRVFRFLDQKYVDQFFADGSLRLSSFNQFGKHSDEQRRDGAEGYGVRSGIGANLTVAMVSGRGSDCYVLCGSMLCTQKLKETFPGADGCFAIDDTVGFAQAVAHALPRFKSGLEGPAIYQDDPAIRRDMGIQTAEEFFDNHKNPDGTLSLNMLADVQSKVGGTEEFFVKHSRYADQAEYRFLWAVEGDAEDFIHIQVPEALKFCRKLT